MTTWRFVWTLPASPAFWASFVLGLVLFSVCR